MATGDYVVLVHAGDVLHPFFTERHLHKHQYMSMAMITWADIRVLDARGALVFAGFFQGTGRWRTAMEWLPGLSGPVTHRAGSPLSASMFRRHGLLEAAVNYLQQVRPDWASAHGETFLQRYAQLIGGGFRFAECLVDIRVQDPAAAFSPTAPAEPAATVTPEDAQEMALAVCEIVCRQFEPLSRLFPAEWFAQVAAWALQGLGAAARDRLQGIVRGHGLAPRVFGLGELEDPPPGRAAGTPRLAPERR
jgi:hypothetical protein